MAIDDRFIIYSCPHYGLCGQPLVAGECMPHCIKLYDMVMSPRSIERVNSRMTERLTIEEVIAHCERRTERAESFFTREKLEVMPIEGSAVKEYWEHRQVREWLLELQERRKNAQRTGEWILEAHRGSNFLWRVIGKCSGCGAEIDVWAGYFPDVPDRMAMNVALSSGRMAKTQNYCQHCGSRNEVK